MTATEFLSLPEEAHYQPHEGAHVGLVVNLSHTIAVRYDGANTVTAPRLFTTVCGIPGTSAAGRGPVKVTDHRCFVHVQPAPPQVSSGAYLGTCVGIGYLRGVPGREDLMEHVLTNARAMLVGGEVDPGDAFCITNILDPGPGEIRGWRGVAGAREHLIVILAKPGTRTDSALARKVRGIFLVPEKERSKELFVGRVPVQFVDSLSQIGLQPQLPDSIFLRSGAIYELSGLTDRLSTEDVVDLVADWLPAILPEEVFYILRSRGYKGRARPGFASYPDKLTIELKSARPPGVTVSRLQSLATKGGPRVAWALRPSLFSERQLDKIQDCDKHRNTQRNVDIRTGTVMPRRALVPQSPGGGGTKPAGGKGKGGSVGRDGLAPPPTARSIW